jgi:hypothetical protein
MKTRRAQVEMPTVEDGPVEAASRAIREYDPAAESEVAMLQRYLEAELTDIREPRRLPLALSLPIVGAVSVGLWAVIAIGLRAIAG